MDKENKEDFTFNAWETLYDTVDNEYFFDRDADLIFSALQKKLRIIPFGDYLKRYIYRKAGFEKPFDEVSIKEYQSVIRDSFSDNFTPCSFEPTKAKLSALSKNWLTQNTVKRKVVFLLGFGLGMSVDDVNEFLTKVLREQSINAKNPFEVICYYCFRKRYNYLKFELLYDTYSKMPKESKTLYYLDSDYTMSVNHVMKSINTENELFSFLSLLIINDNAHRFSVTARNCFDELYLNARILTANIYNSEEVEKHESELKAYRSKLLKSDRIYDFELQNRIERKKSQVRIIDASDITESDLERIISAAIPVDKNGNLSPAKKSKLNAQFSGKRFNRQHISEILAGRSEVNRFDLITLNFFIFSQLSGEYTNRKKRYMEFVESTNQILEKCLLGELSVSNPYECFLMMCILSEDPLGTYADVWELSYVQRNNN